MEYTVIRETKVNSNHITATENLVSSDEFEDDLESQYLIRTNTGGIVSFRL